MQIITLIRKEKKMYFQITAILNKVATLRDMVIQAKNTPSHVWPGKSNIDQINITADFSMLLNISRSGRRKFSVIFRIYIMSLTLVTAK